MERFWRNGFSQEANRPKAFSRSIACCGGEKPLLKYFLDGSRHVFKVDDIAYNKQVFPVVAGQIGIGCCKRENKRMSKERFYRELVLALPDKANADGWDDAAYEDLTKGFDSKKFEQEFYDTTEGTTEDNAFFYSDDDIPRRSVTVKKFYEEILTGLKEYFASSGKEQGIENFVKMRTFLKQYLNKQD